MKKYISLIIVILIMLTCQTFASTNTYERTRENLQINEKFELTESVINAALATPKVDETEKVYDFADLFTDYDEELLYNDIMSYINSYEMDMVIVTINENNKSSAESYADDFYDYNYFGTNSTNDGILFLIDMDTRQFYISTTGKAILIYDDARINDMLDDIYTYMTSAKYYGAANVFIRVATSFAKKGIPSSNKNYTIDALGKYVKKFPWGPCVGFSIFSTAAFLGIVSLLHSNVKTAKNANYYYRNNSLKLDVCKDKFIDTHTSRVYDPPSDSSYGGRSGGGGSSTHSSSSGSSHGGGGRSF